MLKLGQKIGQSLLLVVIGLALTGVNIKQLYCSHADSLHWEVCLLPAEKACPCDESCCGENSCHHNARYAFLKITDFSRTETSMQMALHPLCLPESFFHLFVYFSVAETGYFPFRYKIPDRLMPREWLCTYLC